MQLVEPVTVAYLPAAQSVQSDMSTEPTSAVYFPRAHDAQCLSSATKTAPTEHVVVQLAPKSDEYLPREQSVQSEAAAEPVTGRNLPWTHLMQASKPMAGEYMPTAHALQLEALVSDEYFPGWQSMHS